MRSRGGSFLAGTLLLAGLVAAGAWVALGERQRAAAQTTVDDHECCLPNEAWKLPFKDEVPISYVARGANPAAWDALKAFWNEGTETAIDPKTGAAVERKVVKLKLPLGLNSPPPVPAENPLTVQKWKLGKHLYFDPILSSDRSVSCATCHDPAKGYTDNSPVSTGIRGNKGGVSAPTVLNSAYHVFQFWDGRAASLEDQSQGPPQNALEMFDGDGHAWRKVVERVRAEPELVKQFKQVFGTPPTRDTVAKAIAAYERTVFSGNSIFDRAEQAMRDRVAKAAADGDTVKAEITAGDFLGVLKAAFDSKDTVALKALKLDDAGKADEAAKRLVSGRNLFFGKARCNSCHVGENFTDNTFHNLGVGAKDGELSAKHAGRYGALPPGHKNPDFFGAFKTPTLRHLVGTAPFLHDGSEKTLEDVVEFYDRGGNVNPYLDVKMRDENAEREWYKTKAEGKEAKLPAEARVYDGKVVIPLKLNLSKEEKADLVLFLRALQGDNPDPIVADPKKLP
jgi:cytochrome c peroxidase